MLPTTSNRLGRTFGAGVAVIAVFYTISEFSMPVADRRAGTAMILVRLVLLVTHAAMYAFGVDVRARFGLRVYVGLQAALVLAFGLTKAFFPVGSALYFALTIDTVLLAGATWGIVPIAISAVALFFLNAVLAWDLYRASTLGLLLAVTGLIARAAAGLFNRDKPATTGNGAAQAPTNGGSSTLTARELEVLRAIVAGSRSSQIAAELSITERTVKAHLASIYMKLGVESRAAAVAAALQRGLTS